MQKVLLACLAAMLTLLAHSQQKQPLFSSPPLPTATPQQYISLKKGDHLTLTLQRERRTGRSSFLKGLAKTIGISALAYKLRRPADGGHKGNTARGSIGLSLGLGIAASVPDYLKGLHRTKKAMLDYRFYNRKGKLITGQKITLKNKKQQKINLSAPEDGYAVLNTYSRAKQPYTLTSVKVSGSKGGGNINLLANGGGGGDDGPPLEGEDEPALVLTDSEGNEISFWDNNGDGIMDAMTWGYDGGMVYIKDLSQYSNIGSWGTMEGIPEIMEKYDPEEWENPEEYLDWKDEHGEENNSTPDPCSGKADSIGTAKSNTLKSPAYAGKVDSLTQHITTDTVEKGLSFGTYISNGLPGTTPVLTSTKGGSVDMYATYSGMSIEGTMHSHTGSAYYAPSPGDIYMLAAGNAANSGFNTGYVFGPDGSRYALVVTDASKLATFMANYPPATYFNDSTGGWKANTSIYNDAKKVEDYFNPAGVTGPMAEEAFERAQAYVLSKYDMGLVLLKADAIGNFKEIHTTDTPGPTVFYNKVDCP